MSMSPASSRPVFVCAIGLLGAFFMPWIASDGRAESGYLLSQTSSGTSFLWLVPLLAAITITLSLIGLNNRGIGILTGIVASSVSLIWFVAPAKHLIWFSGAIGDRLRSGSLAIGVWLTLIFGIVIIVTSRASKSAGAEKSP